MRILLPDLSNPTSGRSFFLRELAHEFGRMNIECVYDDGAHDVVLWPIRFGPKTGKPRILRLDGIYHDTGKDWAGKNRGIAASVAEADGVIVQSQWSFEMAQRYVGLDPAKAVVILNGANPNQELATVSILEKTTFVALSKWRPHKRLTDIVASFMMAEIPDSQLVVFGECDIEGGVLDRAKNVYCYGKNATRKIIMQYLHCAAASIHLCWYDSCPNSVVEAVVMRCPVICTNTGGTKEIVEPSGGIVLDLDVPTWDPVDLYHPPAIDREKVAQAMKLCSQVRPRITYGHVEIGTIARQYADYLRRFA